MDQLCVVPKTNCFFLVDQWGTEYPFASTPIEAVLRFALDPTLWPEIVDFWWNLGFRFSDRRFLSSIPEGYKRRQWINVGLIRMSVSPEFGGFGDWRKPFDKIDLWAFARLLDVMKRHKIKVVSTDGWGPYFAHDISLFLSPEVVAVVDVPKDARTNFVPASDEIYRSLGFELVLKK